MTSPIVEKVNKLMNLAERASTPEEAETFFAKAQELVTKYQIDEELLRATRGQDEKNELTQKVFVMGKRRQFGLHTYVRLLNAICNANDVSCAVTSDSTHMYAYGYQSDLDIVEALYTSLLLQMVDASNKYLATGEYRNEKIWREGYWENYGGVRGREWVNAGYKPVHGSTARISFQEAFANRVGLRLRQARRDAMHQAETSSPGTGAELVLASKAEVVERFSSQFMGKGTYKAGDSARSQRAAVAGDEAGRRARIGAQAAVAR